MLKTYSIKNASSVAFSPKGDRLAVTSWAGLVLLDRFGEFTVWSPESAFRLAAFSPDGLIVAAIESRGGCLVFDAATGAVRLTLPQPGKGLLARWRNRYGEEDQLKDASFTDDGSAVMTRAASRAISVWDVVTGALRARVPPRRKFRRRLDLAQFLPKPILPGTNGRYDRNSSVEVWDAVADSVAANLGGGCEPRTAIAFAPGAKALAVSTRDQGLRLLTDAQGGAVNWSGETRNPVLDVHVSPDGKWLAMVTQRGGTLVREVATGFVRHHFPSEPHHFSHVVFTPDSTGMAVAGPTLPTQIQDVESGKVRLTLDLPTGNTHRLAFSNDGRRLVTADNDGYVRDWAVRTGELLSKSRSWPGKIILTPGGGTFDLTGRHSFGSISRNRKTLKLPIDDELGRVSNGVAFSPDGRLAAAAGARKNVVVWSVKTGRTVHSLPELSWNPKVVFSPSGAVLVIAPDQGAPVLYDVETGELRHELIGHLSGITALTFALDGSLVTASVDGSARIWDTSTGTLVSTFVAPPGSGP